MQAIITKFIPATNFKPSRIKASCERGSLTMSYDHEHNEGDAHRAVCDALCARFDAEDKEKYGSEDGHRGSWSRPKASGQIPSGEHVFCFIQDRVLGRAGKMGNKARRNGAHHVRSTTKNLETNENQS